MKIPKGHRSRALAASRGVARRRGVSLLAILVTLLTVALVAGLAIPAFFSRHEVTLDNAAVLLARDLRATQNRAAYLGIETRLVFDENGWRAFDEDGLPLPRVTGSREIIERRFSVDAVFDGVRAVDIQFGDDGATSFGPMGQCLEGGSIVLDFRDEKRWIRVEGDTGRVEIEGLQREWSDDGQ